MPKNAKHIKGLLFRQVGEELLKRGCHKGYTGGWKFIEALAVEITGKAHSQIESCISILEALEGGYAVNPKHITNTNEAALFDRCSKVVKQRIVVPKIIKPTAIPKAKTEYKKPAFGWAELKAFLASDEGKELWRKIRYKALAKADGKCSCCGRSAKDGIVLHVDHIKPKSLYPDLAFEVDNLQVLCDDCNMGKGNTDEIDWRKK